MLLAEELKAYAAALSIPASGICGAEADGRLAAYLQARRAAFPVCSFEEGDLQRRISPKAIMEGAQSVFVCLFPYYIEAMPPGNLSRYAMVKDYHRVIGAYLDKLSAFVTAREPSARCMFLCDTTPLVDRWLAYQAGLGFFGKNNLLIHPVFGSWFFIGALLLNIPLKADKPLQMGCRDCDACIRACPGQALSERFGFNCERCISYLTQKKTLSAEQEQLLEKQGSVYGCDVCQAVCPHNRAVPDTPIQEFYEKPVTRLKQEELAAMSGRDFKRKYAEYAFSWCSKQTILKNFRQPDDGAERKR